MKNSTEYKMPIYKMTLCAIFAALTAVCSWISVPTAVPFTMQTFAVFCALLTLGGRWGTVSIAVYLLIGLAGIPVFADFSGGFSAFLTPSGGFLIGFLFMGVTYWAVTGCLGERLGAKIAAIVSGMAVCYAFGAAGFMLYFARGGSPMGIGESLAVCAVPYIIPDGIKLALAFTVSGRVTRHVRAA